MVGLEGKHLVTGAAGMIGSHLVRRLTRMGYEVVGADNLSSGSVRNIQDLKDEKNFKFIEGDLRQPSLCREVVKGVDFAWSLAANMGGITFITTVHADVIRDNATINLNMLEAARLNKVPHYLFMSSACVYAEQFQLVPDVEPLKESHAYPAMPNESYGWEKLFTEQACLAYRQDYGMNIRIPRLHNVFGTAHTAFDKFKAKAPCMMIARAIQCPKANIEIWNDGYQTRSFLYIDDCIDGLLKLMESGYSEPINIGSDRLISMNDLAKLVIEISGKAMKPVYFPDKPMGVRGRNADLTLVKQVLGWEPKVSLEDGLERVYRWAEKHFSDLENI